MKRTTEDKESLVTLGEKIREIRLLKNLSQIKLATLLNTEKTNLSRLENGGTNPTFLTLKKVADILQVHLCDLIPFGDSEKQNNPKLSQ